MTNCKDNRPLVPPPPAGKVKCGCCGCETEPDKPCHCGAVMSWSCDAFDGWHLVGVWLPYRIKTDG